MSSSGSSLTPVRAPIKARLGFFEDVTSMPLTIGLEQMVKSAAPRRYATATEVRSNFLNEELEVALMPASECLRLKDVMIIPAAAAATVGASRLFMVFSKKLPTDIRRVLIDQEDLGGGTLAKLMLAKKMSVRPEFVQSQTPLDPASYDLMQDDGFDAYVVSGRNCLFVRKDVFAFTMDLTLAWYEYTRLPYVIHVWALKKSVAGRILSLEKELGDVARRNEGSNEVAQKSSERANVSATTLKMIYDKALTLTFDAMVIQSLRKYGQELMANRIVPTQPITLYAAAPTRKV